MQGYRSGVVGGALVPDRTGRNGLLEVVTRSGVSPGSRTVSRVIGDADMRRTVGCNARSATVVNIILL